MLKIISTLLFVMTIAVLWASAQVAGVAKQSVIAHSALVINSGTPVQHVVKQLFGTEQLSVFERAWLASRPVLANIKAGEYEIQAQSTLVEALQKMLDGKVIEYSAALIEGQTLRDWLLYLQQFEQLQQDVTFSDIAWEYRSATAQFKEGYVLPDTYQFRRGDRVSDILIRAQQAQQKKLASLIEEYALPEHIANVHEWITLASIIEKETAVATERTLIAGVFLNRLERGMRLQTDPTVIYGIGPQFNGNITRTDLQTKTSHNTYRIDGLPPTPIAAPSSASLLAVLTPEATEALFFVAKGDGTHHFSKTLAEHNRAVRKYQLNQ